MAALAVAVSLLASCGPQDGDVAELREQVDALQQDGDATSARVETLVAELDELRALTDPLADAEVTTRLGRVEEGLDDLDARLVGLVDEQATDAAALADLAADSEAAAGDLRSRAAALEGAVTELRGQLDEVRTLTGTLRDRLDRLQRGG